MLLSANIYYNNMQGRWGNQILPRAVTGCFSIIVIDYLPFSPYCCVTLKLTELQNPDLQFLRLILTILISIYSYPGKIISFFLLLA